jgi:glycosyltransferase involved in cell wall biosynthesis
MSQDITHLLIEDLPAMQSQLRIAVVTETYPPEVNGVAITLQRVVAGLRDRGHRVQLVRPRQTKDDTQDRPALHGDVLTRGMAIPRYPHLQLGLPSRKRLESLWTLQRPDVVHIATEGPLGWSALRLARKLRIPVTSDFRTNFHAYSSHYGMGWLSKPIMAYLKRFHNNAMSTMVPTRGLAESLATAGFERLKVVARGVDSTLFHPDLRDPTLRAAWGAAPNTPVVLCVGRLAKEKNLPLLIRAYAQAKLIRPDLRLVLVGDGPMRAELESLAPDAIFTGSLNREVLARHYASADIFGFPSQSETFGNVVLEAMASSLAVVAFDYAAAQENIDHSQNGLLARMGDNENFAQLLIDLTKNDSLQAQLRSAARAKALGCDWQSIVGQIEVVMQQAVSGVMPTLSRSVASHQMA